MAYDPWVILEPFMFVPIPALFVLMTHVVEREKLMRGVFAVSGIMLLTIATISLIPSNSIVSFFQLQADGNVNFFDSMVPVKVFTNYYLWIQVPIMAGTGDGMHLHVVVCTKKRHLLRGCLQDKSRGCVLPFPVCRRVAISVVPARWPVQSKSKSSSNSSDGSGGNRSRRGSRPLTSGCSSNIR